MYRSVGFVRHGRRWSGVKNPRDKFEGGGRDVLDAGTAVAALREIGRVDERPGSRSGWYTGLDF
jgi:hypothetical protein